MDLSELQQKIQKRKALQCHEEVKTSNDNEDSQSAPRPPPTAMKPPGTKRHSPPGTMRTSSPGTMRPSPPGTMRPSPPGTMRPSPPGTMRPSPPGTMRPSPPGTMRPSPPGTMRPSPPGTVRPSPPGTMRPSSPGTKGHSPPTLRKAMIPPTVPMQSQLVAEEEHESSITRELQDSGSLRYHNTAWQSNNHRNSLQKASAPPVPHRRPQTVLSTYGMDSDFPPPPPPLSSSTPDGSVRYATLHQYLHGVPIGVSTQLTEKEQMIYIQDAFNYIKDVFEAEGVTEVTLCV